MWFTSDNAGPAHPRVIEALAAANAGNTPGYGAEAAMEAVRARIREIFEAPEAAVYLVATGTAANALSLAVYARPWSAIYCSDTSHVEWDECGAPEFYTGGAKLALIPAPDGKMDPAALARKLDAVPAGFVHHVQKGPLTITQVTECGSVYTLDEIRTLTGIAKSHGIPVHMDGARFANAVVALGCTPAELTWKSGVDVLSFGGTKNGLLAAEAVVLFDPDKAWEFELRRKRGAHLFSKHRILSAQMQAYLDGDLWLDMARQANAMGQRLAAGLADVPDMVLDYPADANMVFLTMPRARHRRLIEAGAHYYFWPHDGTLDGPEDDPLGCRMVCSWSTSEAEVDALLEAATP